MNQFNPKESMKDFLAYGILALLLVTGYVFGGTAVGGATFQEETTESGGNLAEWQQTLLSTTGSASEEYQTALQCDSLMKQKIEECKKYSHWSVDNMMEITDFKTGQHYSFQDIKQQSCPDNKQPEKVHIDKASLDTQSDSTASAYQVICSVTCNKYDCETDLTGTWSGTYIEMQDATYCKFKETGTKTFEIIQTDTSFSGTTKYSGTSVITGGEHCQGSTSSSSGKLSGKIDGNKVTGTMQYGTAVPFTATVEGDIMKGTYSYSTNAYGSPFSGTGEFELKKK